MSTQKFFGKFAMALRAARPKTNLRDLWSDG